MSRARLRIMQLTTVAIVILGSWALGRSGLFEWSVSAVASLGPWALPAFFVLHAVSGVLFVPNAIPNLAAGVLFGVSKGLLVSLAGLSVGSMLAFAIGRVLGRDWLHRRFDGDARFHGLIRLVGQRGWKIIVLARLSPIFPFAVANYAFGLTSMRATTYGLASLVGSIPSTLVFVSLGTAAGGLGGDGRTPGEWALLGLGTVAMLALVLVVRRIALDAFAELRALEGELEGEAIGTATGESTRDAKGDAKHSAGNELNRASSAEPETAKSSKTSGDPDASGAPESVPPSKDVDAPAA